MFRNNHSLLCPIFSPNSALSTMDSLVNWWSLKYFWKLEFWCLIFFLAGGLGAGVECWEVCSLCSNVFERRTSSELIIFALLSRDFEQISGQIFSERVKTLGNTNLLSSRHIHFRLTSRRIKREKGWLSVNMRRSKTSLKTLRTFCSNFD